MSAAFGEEIATPRTVWMATVTSAASSFLRRPPRFHGIALVRLVPAVQPSSSAPLPTTRPARRSSSSSRPARGGRGGAAVRPPRRRRFHGIETEIAGLERAAEGGTGAEARLQPRHQLADGRNGFSRYRFGAASSFARRGVSSRPLRAVRMRTACRCRGREPTNSRPHAVAIRQAMSSTYGVIAGGRQGGRGLARGPTRSTAKPAAPSR